MKKNDLEFQINEFLSVWDLEQMQRLLIDIFPILELYEAIGSEGWLKEAVGEEDEINVRLIRTVYLVSRLSDFHAGKLATIKAKFPFLWKRLEEHDKKKQ